jgi:hypothetical protein
LGPPPGFKPLYCATVFRTNLDERSARRTDLYMTKHNPYNRQTSMPPMIIEPTTAASERLYTYAVERQIDKYYVKSDIVLRFPSLSYRSLNKYLNYFPRLKHFLSPSKFGLKGSTLTNITNAGGLNSFIISKIFLSPLSIYNTQYSSDQTKLSSPSFSSTTIQNSPIVLNQFPTCPNFITIKFMFQMHQIYFFISNKHWTIYFEIDFIYHKY